jgi:hypothetical protein
MTDPKDFEIQTSSDKNIAPYSNQLVKRGLDLLSKIHERIIRVPQDFSSLEEAVEKANEGDTIEISGGTYFVKLNINKNLSLKGKIHENITLRPKEHYIVTSKSLIGTINFENIHFSGEVSSDDHLANTRPNPTCVILLAGDANFSNCVFEKFKQSFEYWDYLDNQNMDDEYENCNCIFINSNRSKIHLDNCIFGKSCDVGIMLESKDNIITLNNNFINAPIYLGKNSHVTSHHNYFNGESFACDKNSVFLSHFDTFKSQTLLVLQRKVASEKLKLSDFFLAV